MKAILIREQAPRGPVAPLVATVDGWPDPGSADDHEILVRCEASALNHMDLWVGMGIPGVDIEYPHIGGVDGCGIVEAVGDDVDPSWIGRRVVHNAAVVVPGTLRPGEPTARGLATEVRLIGEHSPGTHRELYRVPAENAVDIGGADPVAAAAFGLTGLTAYSKMITKGQLRPGQTVLITGIGGGVATAALSIARWMGCTTIVTSRHAWKLDRAKELGADHVVLDTGQDWSREVRGLTDKRGVDMVVDTVGGPLLTPSLRTLVPGGAFVTAGSTASPKAELELARVFWKQLRVLGSTMGTNDEFREIMALFQAGRVEPVVDRVYAPEDAPDAWERLESGDQMGKLVIDWRKGR